MSATTEPSSEVNDRLLTLPQDVVNRAIEIHYSSLRTGIQVIIAKSGLVDSTSSITDLGDEVLHNTVETALRVADRFDPSRSAYSWLMGIAVNKLKEIRKTIHRDDKRILRVSDKNTGDYEPQGEQEDNEGSTSEEQLDAMLYRSSGRSSLEDSDPALEELLSLVNEGDRKVLSLAFVDGLSGAEVAAILGIREGAAYVRAARAKERLLKKYLTAHERNSK